ncbi:hypothetical protein PISMIDRAFT_532766 [Pisolithus microcarpus 441]|uniref:Protein transport protein SEC13 n=1 Tax=Pisolithus microcarpus 441 TaxID=765257 RepID=A0A0C9YYX3_9AGAM|nr:hypothetical protein PISMIDRAFT_532766 [Pisolithus microcarpus 441]
MNSISWAPHELGAILACASSNGKISVLTFNDDATHPGSLILPQQPGTHQPSAFKKLVSAGCDKIWCFREETRSWVEEEKLEGHTDWVRDVAWAPNIGLPRSYIATASQDKTVLIWTKDSPTAP